jgi:hypothetical protein
MRANVSITLRCLAFAAALAAMVAAPVAAFEQRTYPDFVQIVAVQPRPAGGFAITGFLRGEVNKPPSGFQLIGANGEPVGRPTILPSPSAQHPQVWVSGLLLLPSGDYVVGGWAENQRGKPDGWLARIAPNGDIVWNVITGHELDQRIYSVKRLSNGNLIAVGRVQQGAELRQPARGYVVTIDESDGRQLLKGEFPFANDTLRSAFQDVTELADGNLLFAGWMTKPDGSDEIWVLKTTMTGDRIRSVAFGEASNDIAWSVSPFGAGVAVAATTRKSRDSSVGNVVVFDKDLSRRTVLNLDRFAPGMSQARAVVDLSSTGQVVVAGLNARSNAAEPVALGGIVNTLNSTASVQEASGGISSFRAAAVDGAGTIAMAGDTREARDRPQRGLIGLRTVAAACAPDARRHEEISGALLARGKERHTACARPDRPARFRIGPGGRNLAIVIRPLVGDVDALLMRGNEILDTSLNAMRRPEILPLPATGRDFEVTVSSVTPYATFEIALATIATPRDDPYVMPRLGLIDSQDADDSEDGDPFIAQALQWLGYDLLGSENAGRGTVSTRRAVMAFQANEGFPITGAIANEAQLIRLLQVTARHADVEASQAAETAREVAARAPPVESTDANEPLLSLRAGVHNGRVYGIAQLRIGGTFEGEFADSAESGLNQRPRQGVIRVTGDCSISLRAVTTVSAQYLPVLLSRSVGVVRHGRRVAYARELGGLVPRDPEQQRQLQLATLCTARR